MSRPEASPPAPRFRLWLRRQVIADGPYSVRFEVTDGKGILRVSRPGVLIDPPARPTALEEHLTAAQLRASRFLLVWDGGRARQAHLLTRLQEAALSRLEPERWYEAEVLVEGGFRHLILSLAPAPGEQDEPTVPIAIGSVSADTPSTASAAFPFSPASLTHSAIHGGLPAPVATVPQPIEYGIDGTTILTADDLLPLADTEGDIDENPFLDALPEEVTEEDRPDRRRRAEAQDDPAMDAFGVDEEDAAFAVDTPGHRLETQHVLRGVVEAVTFLPTHGPADDEVMEAGEADEDAEALPAGEADEDAAALQGGDAADAEDAADELIASAEADEDGHDGASLAFASPPQAEDTRDDSDEETPVGDGDGLHGRQTTLVRHLRRQVAEQKTRIQALEARVRELESQLGPD